MLFADGRVSAVSDSLPPEKLRALLTIAGGEDISFKELEEEGLLY